MTDNFNPIIWAAFVSVPWGLFALWCFERGKAHASTYRFKALESEQKRLQDDMDAWNRGWADFLRQQPWTVEPEKTKENPVVVGNSKSKRKPK
jgi:hypothetical protein